MNDGRIQEALNEASDTRGVVIGSGVISSVANVFERDFGDSPAVIVADENTFAVAGEEIKRLLQEAGREMIEPYVFPGEPGLYAGYSNIERLVESFEAHDAIPISVGAGTVNDLVKRAAGECDRPYLCVGTAASMDGYTSFGASISKDGRKQTLACPAPRSVLLDLDILVNAPAPMTAAGYADLLGKVTAGADWLVADALGAEEMHPRAWSLVHDSLREWTADPAALRAGDPEAMGRLIEGLSMCGIAMQTAESSRPASGGEHYFSHLWEMEGLGAAEDPPLSHGFKVGLGTISIAALYERILQRDLADLNIAAVQRDWPTWPEVEKYVRETHGDPDLAEASVGQSRDKYVDSDGLAERLELLKSLWPELREKLSAQLMPAAELRESLRAAGCPTSSEEIGLSREDFRATYFRARTIRARYTALDLATETGILEECVEELFAPGGFWGDGS